MHCPGCGETVQAEVSYCRHCGANIEADPSGIDSGTQEPIGETGSTDVGVLSVLVALFFVYGGVQRLWWSIGFNIPDYLLLAVIYLVVGWVATGSAVYGIHSKELGAKLLSAGSIVFGAIVWIAALYYWISGNFLGGTPTDIFNAIVFGLTGIVLYIIGGAVGRLFVKRGVLDSEAIEDIQAE